MSITSEERQEILQLLAAGKVSVEEAAAMLSGTKTAEQIDEAHAGQEVTAKKVPDPTVAEDAVKIGPDPGLAQTGLKEQSGPSWLRVRVSDIQTGKSKVSVNVPMRLVRFGLAIGRRYAPELDELDWEQISGFLSAEKGMLVEVEDQEDGDHVQIYVD